MKKVRFTFIFIDISLILAASFCAPIRAADIKHDDENGYRLNVFPQTGWSNNQFKYRVYLAPAQPLGSQPFRRITPTNSELQVLKNEFPPPWNFVVAPDNLRAPGELQVKHYDAEYDDPPSYFTVEYVSPFNWWTPRGEVLRWIQFVTTSFPPMEHQEPTPYVDPTWWDANHNKKYDANERNFEDSLPFYWNPSQIAQYSTGGALCPAGVDIRFLDSPWRWLTVHEARWIAIVYLVTWNNQTPGTVTFHDGIQWGYKIDRVDEGFGPNQKGGVGADKFEHPLELTPVVLGFDAMCVTNMYACPANVVAGEPIQIEALVENLGGTAYTSRVAVYADKDIDVYGDEITIGEQMVYDLPPNASTLLDFSWNTIDISAGWYTISAEASVDSGGIDYIMVSPIRITTSSVGGIWVPVDKFGLLAPHIGLASTLIAATAATAIYIKRRKKKQ